MIVTSVKFVVVGRKTRIRAAQLVLNLALARRSAVGAMGRMVEVLVLKSALLHEHASAIAMTQSPIRSKR
jgi:hypothetical protein